VRRRNYKRFEDSRGLGTNEIENGRQTTFQTGGFECCLMHQITGYLGNNRRFLEEIVVLNPYTIAQIPDIVSCVKLTVTHFRIENCHIIKIITSFDDAAP
jgi:hypothetical protein